MQNTDILEKGKFRSTQAQAQAGALMLQKSLVKIISKIRRSLDFSEICQTATDEVYKVLKADRVNIYRFNEDWSGQFLYETVNPQWASLLDLQTTNDQIGQNVSACSLSLLDSTKATDTHLVDTQGGAFAEGEIFRVCPDIYGAGFSQCYINFLESYHVRAYSIIAIYIDQKLWGLLAAYQNSGPRQWDETEVQLLVNVAEQLGVALKQADYVQTIENQSIQLNQTLKELKQSQAQLIQREKMASLGQFVAGIAHEINNPVNFIYGNLAYVDEYVSDLLALTDAHSSIDSSQSPPLADDSAVIDYDFIRQDLPKILGSMKVGAERIRNIVLSLRNFSRLDEADIKAVNIHEGLDSTLLLLGHRLKPDDTFPAIEIIKDYGNLPEVECYPAQLNQVFMNLLSNAIDAVKEAYPLSLSNNNQPGLPAKIWISTMLIQPDEVEIRIRDSGIGLKSQDLSKLFDYFYTTKPVGQGTGLGLAISRQIVTERHCGQLQANPDLERGAEFIIRLPLNLSTCLG
ncbi:histidine kinase [filamentous cyanobacterium CCP5]|nr:histidine kinase [filamentous cyanobacterium CCP5]